MISEVVSALVLIVIGWFGRAWFNREWARGSEPPVSRGLPWLGKAKEFATDALQLLTETRAKLGDIFTIIIAGQRMTFICPPDAFSSVFKEKSNLSFKEIAEVIGAQSVGSWAAQELADENGKKLEEYVHDQYLAHLKGGDLDSLIENAASHMRVSLLERPLTRATADWKKADLVQWTWDVIFVVTTQTLYGSAFYHPEALNDFRKWDEQFALLAAGIPGWLIGAEKHRRQLAEKFAGYSREAHADVSALVNARIDSWEKLGVAEYDVKRFHIGLMWAAMANTAPATFWTLYYIMHNPEALASISEEVRRVIAEHNPSGSDPMLDRDSLDKMQLLESAINETLRLSAASMSIRVVMNDFVFTMPDGQQYSLRKGDRVALYPPLTHFNPEVFANPEQFIYDRFIGPDGTVNSKKFSYKGKPLAQALVPFGGGISQCPGRKFAVAEIKSFVAWIIYYLEVRVDNPSAAPAYDKSRAGLGILPPKDSVPFSYRLRSSN